MEFDNRIVK